MWIFILLSSCLLFVFVDWAFWRCCLVSQSICVDSVNDSSSRGWTVCSLIWCWLQGPLRCGVDGKQNRCYFVQRYFFVELNREVEVRQCDWWLWGWDAQVSTCIWEHACAMIEAFRCDGSVALFFVNSETISWLTSLVSLGTVRLSGRWFDDHVIKKLDKLDVKKCFSRAFMIAPKILLFCKVQGTSVHFLIYSQIKDHNWYLSYWLWAETSPQFDKILLLTRWRQMQKNVYLGLFNEMMWGDSCAIWK